MINFLQEAKNNQLLMIDIRRELHMYPELDRNLFRTGDLVEKYLKQNKIDCKRFSNNGIIAELGSGKNILALRADMDALQVNDLKDKEYKSKIDGAMHACGHDAHTSILIGTALILKKYEDMLKCRIRLIFQPAEETDGGAQDMIKYGCLEGVSGIIGLHVDEKIDTGTVEVKKGLVYAASNPFKITIMGKGAHGAYPSDGIDAIMIGAKVINNLQEIISREVSATQNAVITVGKINGGTVANAISSKVEIEGILRTVGSDLREFCKDRIKEVVLSTAKMYRGDAKIEFIESYPSFENNESLVDYFNKEVKGLNFVKIITGEQPSMGVEDFSYYTKVVPGLFYKLGCRNIEKGIIHPAHGSYFDIDEECLYYGCALQTLLAFNFFS